MADFPFYGVGTALITPFHEDGSLDFDALGRLIDYQIAHRADALVILGTTGEASTLTDGEREAVIRFSVSRVKGRIPLVVGAGSNDTAHAAALARSASSLGADALLVVTPYYNKTSPAGLITHFSAVADASEVPVILYHVPSRTGVKIPFSVFEALSSHPRVVGVKEASGDLSLAARILGRLPLRVWSGNDELAVPLLSLGGSGVISVLSNLVPDAVHELCRAMAENRLADAARAQVSFMPLIDALFADVNPIPVKAAAAMMGFCGETVRLPLVPPDAGVRSALASAMRGAGLI